MNSVNTTTDNTNELTEQIQSALSAGASMAEIQGISKYTLEGVYAYAYDFYEKGRLDDAELFFKFLCIYDFQNADYLKGYAAVCHLKKQYQRAYDLYGLSFTVNHKFDYSPIYLMGQCQLCLKNIEMAKSCFESVVLYSKDDDLISKASTYLGLFGNTPSEVEEVAS
ncbi:TPA: tetratricopeptide repeat protein [Yersinia enterocolitica]|nr:tetratricopeptide repeat protein [Yersinia enterocolitica]